MLVKYRQAIIAVIAILPVTGCGAVETPDGGEVASTSADLSLLSLQSLICEGRAVATYDPPVTNTPQLTTVHVDVRYGLESAGVGACLVVGAPITGGFRSSTVTLITSCTELLNSVPGLVTQYSWNDGSASTTKAQIQAVNRLESTSEIVEEGTITSGFGEGHHADWANTYPNLALDACATTGVSRLEGASKLTILPL